MKGAVYLVVVDYHSRYPELALLDQGTSSQVVIQHLKSIFARHGIPKTVISDNGPQFISFAFIDFARKYGFKHVTTSPRYPQANGEAERMVGTLKRLLKKAQDPYIALLNYRNTPGPTSYSPAQLLMSHRLRSRVPCMPSALKPRVVTVSWKKQDEKYRQKQKMYFDRRHAVRPLPSLSVTQSSSWCNLMVNLSSDHHTLATELQVAATRAPERIIKIRNWDAFRRNRTSTTPQDSPFLEAWMKQLQSDLKTATKCITATTETPDVDRHLLHLWDAHRGLTRRWRRQMHNRKLRLRIANLAAEANDYANTLTSNNWHNFCDRLNGTKHTSNVAYTPRIVKSHANKNTHC